MSAHLPVQLTVKIQPGSGISGRKPQNFDALTYSFQQHKLLTKLKFANHFKTIELYSKYVKLVSIVPEHLVYEDRHLYLGTSVLLVYLFTYQSTKVLTRNQCVYIYMH